ncbi:hypothetical protein IV203_003560 [Nitzschia inconspicua]|uniref:Uncharacterized protein n=1 Tax=Nitzschia inconspicua TaxID=303405 RepID=A0A9K3L2T8_9STRA|nr:hypothetical protein IV203_003560 [Nitzschia inconspicua]
MPQRFSPRTWLVVVCIVTLSQIIWWNRQTHILDLRYQTDVVQQRQQSFRPSKQKITMPSLAIVVAGSAQRLLFNSTVHHVIRPMNNQYVVDYFAAITLQSGPAFRQASGYMGHLGYDPLLQPYLKNNNNNKNNNSQTTNDVSHIQSTLQQVMSQAIASVSSTAKLRTLRVLAQPMEDDPILDPLREKIKTNNNNNNDMYRQFPMMDRRPQALERTHAGNRNMIRLFLLLESLWHDVETAERIRGSRYDYILLVRDDTLWLDDFHIDRLLVHRPTPATHHQKQPPDAYILSCDARTPTMLPPEINDHGMLIRRDRAEVVGKYVTTLVQTDLQKCHRSVTQWLGKERGCNSEMILKHILKEHNIQVQLVPQSLLPFERAVVVEYKSGRNEYCFHKFCQSTEQPLTVPAGMKKCNDITSFE